MTKKVLIIAANPTVSSTTGWPVGFWVSEVAHPYKVFRERGYQVTIASPKGGKLEMDSVSDPNHESGYSSWDSISKDLLEDNEFKSALDNTPSITDIDQSDFDALVVAGGQAPMFNFEDDHQLQKFFSDFYLSGKTTSALCHGTAILRFAKDDSGQLLVKGKKVTGFTNGEEDDADAAAGIKVMPWRIEEELIKLGAQFEKADNWQPYVVVDGNLVTGQQNMSGEAVANEIVKILEP